MGIMVTLMGESGIVNIEDLIQELKNDKKKLGGVCCCLFLILLLAAGMTNVQDLNNTNINMTDNTEEDLYNKSIGISTSHWDYTPEGYPLLGDNIYGTCQGVDQNGVEHTYLFTGKQMAALGNISDYTFEFTNLHVIGEENDKGVVVTHMFYRNGSEIPLDWDEYDFAAYAKIAGANNPNCEAGFGYTTSEVNKME